MLRFALLFCCAVAACAQQYLVSGSDEAPHRGVYEVRLRVTPPPAVADAALDLRVTFTLPSGAKVNVDGFHDGEGLFKARAYVVEQGLWRWSSTSAIAALDGRSGTFRAGPSALKGKLRRHTGDPRQFAYDNGEWFLHIGDTGYRYVVAGEAHWRAYIDQAAAMGATKIRTWFAQSRHNVEALFNEQRTALALPYWQEIERRVLYALNRHPDVILQLIPYAEDTDEIRRYADGDAFAQLAARHAQARFSAFPNVHWTLTNDREIVRGDAALTGRQVRWSTIDQMGRDMAAREPWGTLITNHQMRFSGYDFTDAAWSDVITIEDLDQLTGKAILDYRGRRAQPIVNDEDRYEAYRNPGNPRYFFRRLMWASLLSGGHATYGGLRSYEAYDDTGMRGVSGYDDANRAGLLAQGAHDFVHIHKFFRDTRLTLVGLVPDDALVGGDPRRWKCIRDERTILVYLANPEGASLALENPGEKPAWVELTLPEGEWRVRWFDPKSGAWIEGPNPAPGAQRLQSPVRAQGLAAGDWVVLLQRQ